MRVSLGLASNFADAYALVRFAGSFRDAPSDLSPDARPGRIVHQ